MNQASPNGQNVDEPVTQWTHVAETVNMLYLAVCQIEATLNDSNSSVETLTKSFTTLANHTGEVSNHVQHVTKVEELQEFKDDLVKTAGEMQSNINSSIQAFQFYDRVCQRLDHVARSLEKVTSLMEDTSRLGDPDEWKNVQHKIKESYTMEAERIMFEYIMRGGKVRDALKIYHHHFTEENNSSRDDDEVELF